MSTRGLLLDVQDVDFDSELSREHIAYLSTMTRPSENGERFRLMRARNAEKVAQARVARPNKVA